MYDIIKDEWNILREEREESIFDRRFVTWMQIRDSICCSDGVIFMSLCLTEEDSEWQRMSDLEAIVSESSKDVVQVFA